jgi:uncharacterized protein (TIGR03067 family)
MKNAVVLSAAFVLCVVTFAKSGDSKEDVKAMEGTWLPLSAELSGAKFPDEVLKIMKLTLKGETYSVDVGGKLDKGTCKIDASKKPKTLDIVGTEGPNQGKTIPAIYELTKDGLKVCYDLSGKERPKEFKSEKGTQQFLVVYQREKK